MEMRRKDREVTDVSEINAVIEKCYSIKVGFYDDGHVYVVPVNFGFEENGGKYTFYFHGALAGRKADWNFPEVMLSKTGVFKIEVTELSCKAHKKERASV